MRIRYLILSLALCSCASTDYRTALAKKHGVSAEMLQFVEGKWQNIPRKQHSTRTLWESLTTEESPSNAVVMLEMPDKRTLAATLLVGSEKKDLRKVKVKQRGLFITPPKQHSGVPILWYVVWLWRTDVTYLGVTVDGDLWVNTLYNGKLMFSVWPLFGAGGGDGAMDLYERVKE